MKVRNEDARCENCPYWSEIPDPPRPSNSVGICHRYPTMNTQTHFKYVCGEHPDFFKETGECQTNTD